MTIIVGCGHFYVAVYKLFMWSTILGRAPGARNWSHPHPWTICLCQIPSAWVCQEQHIENIYQDCSSSGLWADCIAQYNIVFQSIAKFCRGLLWTMGEARHRKPMKWNAFKSKLSLSLHLILQSIRVKGCFASDFGRYDLSICYVFYCNDQPPCIYVCK